MITRFKEGVEITPDSAGTRLLAAIDRVASNSHYDVVVTSGSESHPPDDVHTLGRAFDLRSHDFTDDEKADLMRAILAELGDDQPEILSLSGIWYALASETWFVQLEHHDEAEEHIHAQLRNGAIFV